MSMKNPLTQAGIEPATFRIVAQHLNHWATAVPHLIIIGSTNFYISSLLFIESSRILFLLIWFGKSKCGNWSGLVVNRGRIPLPQKSKFWVGTLARSHCWLEVSIRKFLRPATSTQVFLGFPVSICKCWDGSQDSKLPLHASHVALPT